MRINSPCFTCVERCILCHAHCEKYAEWTKMMKERKKRPVGEIEADAVAIARKKRSRLAQQERWREMNR